MKKVQVVIGGSTGIGFSTAKFLGERGPLLITSRSAGKLKAAAEELKALGHDVTYMTCDSQKREDVIAVAEKAQSMGEIGTVLCSAGLGPFNEVDDILKTNVLGAYYATEAFYPLMGEGSVMVNIASVAAHISLVPMSAPLAEVFEAPDAPDFLDKLKTFLPESMPSVGAYGVSKMFVLQYSQKNTRRFAQKGARIFTVSPGSIWTPMVMDDTMIEAMKASVAHTPIPRYGDSDELGRLIAYLSSDACSYLTGCDILNDGGDVAAKKYKQIGCE